MSEDNGLAPGEWDEFKDDEGMYADGEEIVLKPGHEYMIDGHIRVDENGRIYSTVNGTYLGEKS